MTDANKVLQALGDATRRDMVERLTDTAMSVSALAAPYDMTLTAVAQHLAILEAAGLVKTEKNGRVRSCRLDTKGFDILDAWSKARRPLWQKRLDALGDVLDET
ncbi:MULTISPECIES: helix-turn-helix transcriptional regulator [Asticcacaulis]|uniref:ArsR/SmtB family transcription factor n=1 Tax=Asticcacaulis TaxID=76890 RepID=UPI001AE5F8B9|nr:MULTISPECIES: metalloregulator ArsR/SmtB family transcription factor [Asticcacaulis]MBP2161752.1 DNA-binding transcriptional ArsR family regulator [Asticcacaulis solisilvae]MDR6802798.1 DNA-binding transcriptional ArsR family regulator [Asticcacaulis sp. BE141]